MPARIDTPQRNIQITHALSCHPARKTTRTSAGAGVAPPHPGQWCTPGNAKGRGAHVYAAAQLAGHVQVDAGAWRRHVRGKQLQVNGDGPCGCAAPSRSRPRGAMATHSTVGKQPDDHGGISGWWRRPATRLPWRGARRVVRGARCAACGVWCAACGVWCAACGAAKPAAVIVGSLRTELLVHDVRKHLDKLARVHDVFPLAWGKRSEAGSQGAGGSGCVWGKFREARANTAMIAMHREVTWVADGPCASTICAVVKCRAAFRRYI